MENEQYDDEKKLLDEEFAAGKLQGMAEQVNRLLVLLQRARLAEYVSLMSSPWGLMWRSFVSGMFRGMGFALGFVMLSALALYLLNLLVDLGIPILGEFIAELLFYVESVQVTR